MKNPGHKVGWTVCLAVVIFLASGTVSCTREEGHAVSPMALAQIQAGKTGKAGVLRILGAPDERGRILGEELWTWRHVVNHGIASVRTRVEVVRIRFDRNGKVEQITRRHQDSSALF